jgi:hypothetical protein
MSTVVNVSVSSTGIISCSPDPVPVSGSNATITFNLHTSGYAFPGNLAVVVSNPGSQFPNGSVTASSILVTLLDVNSDSNSYKYTVNLIKTADNSALSLDPTIENGR